MKKIEKHKFEAVSLLTTQSGSLDVTIIPADGQPDWLLPSNLILAIEPFEERIWNYLWKNQDVSVYHLLSREVQPEKIIVVEGNTAVHRIALQVKGQLRNIQVKISDVRDAILPDGFAEVTGSVHSNESFAQLLDDNRTIGVPYIYQTVEIEGETYIVPDVDTIAHELVDLDS